MKPKIFVDGQEGTTGLKIHDYLAGRTDLEVLKIDPDKRKDPQARKELINSADIVFLCLPDEAAKESVALAVNAETRIIDASTAFRTHDNWIYGLPELSTEQRVKIAGASRVSNPGCHATGFALIVYPLLKSGYIASDYPITCTSITGYSGGGKKLIEKFENKDRDPSMRSPKHYALTLMHKHLPEMQKVAWLQYPPLFTPIIGDFYKGMAVSVPLLPRFMEKAVTAAGIQAFLEEYYAGQKFVKVMPLKSDAYLDEGFLNAEACNDTNKAEIFVFGNDKQILVTARFDNLGKGASGAAIQNMNIMLGMDEATGLI